MTAASPTLASTEPLSKVDSLIDSPKSPLAKQRRRSSAAAPDVFNIADLEAEKVSISIAPETQKLGWKINSPATTIDDREFLALPLCTPKVKKIDLVFQAGLHVVARNLRGVTIKDAVDAIYKANKKKSADELDNKEYLRGFEWDPDECYTRFVVHTCPESAVHKPSEKKKKAKKGSE